MLRRLEEANQTLQTWLAERSPVTDAFVAVVEPKRHDPGRPIADARVNAGLGLRELSLRTKIGLRYLEAIERFDVADLPRPVYLRGYLREIARALDLDPDPLTDAYLTALNETRQQRILTTRDRSDAS
jgi:cytoskeletal protein RodZ